MAIYNDFGNYWIIYEPLPSYKVLLIIDKKSGSRFMNDKFIKSYLLK